MIKSYSLFLESIYKKEETCYYFSDRLMDVFQRMHEMGLPMSNLLLPGQNNRQVKDDITFIDITNKEDIISFIQVNRLSRMKDNDLNLEDWVGNIWASTKSTLDFRGWKEQRTEMGVGRFFNRFYQKFNIPINDKSKEILVNGYKASYKSIKYADTKFELVKGEDIRKWYLQDRYEMSKGQLASSCMRYDKCQPYFDIYVKNPEVCSLLILHGEDPEKIIGRALVWNISNGKYLDRIYTNIDSDINLFIIWAKNNDIEYTHYGSNISSIEVKLSNQSYDKFPYMDTFMYYNNKEHILSSDESNADNEDWWELTSTDGSYVVCDRVWSDWVSDYIDRDIAVLCDDNSGWLPRDEARWIEYKNIWVSPDNENYVFSDYDNEYYYIYDCVYSDLYDTYVLTSNSIKVWIASNTEESIPKEEIDKVIKVKIGGELKKCLSNFIIYNVYTNTWLFRNDNLKVYYCDKVKRLLTEEDAKKKGFEIDKTKSELINSTSYVSSLTDVKDGDLDRLSEYIRKVKLTEDLKSKMMNLFSTYDYNRCRRGGDGRVKNLQAAVSGISDETIFELVKLGIWLLPPYSDRKRRNDYKLISTSSLTDLSSKEVKDFLDEKTYSIISNLSPYALSSTNSIFGSIVRNISEEMVYDVIKDKEMLSIFTKIKI